MIKTKRANASNNENESEVLYQREPEFRPENIYESLQR
jgi:hypothetical protein